MKYWVCLWCAIAAACIIGGIVTSVSYTSLSPNQKEVLNSIYLYPDKSAIEPFQNVNYTTVAKQSSLVVTCRFIGKREIQNWCYLSEVRVTSVLKGESNLKGKTLNVYEPVWTQYQNESFVKNVLQLNIGDLSSKFGWKKNSRYVISEPFFVTNSYYTLMNKSDSYLLFLNPKKQFSEQDQIGLANYVQTDSIFSKLTVSNLGAADYQVPPDDLTVGDSMKYEILLKDPPCITAYFGTKKLILKQAHLQ